MCSAVLLISCAGTPTPTTASTCKNLLSSVEVQDFDDVWRVISSLPKKVDVFETGAELSSRQAPILQNMDDRYLVKMRLTSHFVQYDSDKQILIIPTAALAMTSVSQFDLQTAFGAEHPIVRNSFSLSKSDTTSIGTFIGENAFGLQMDVREDTRIVRSVAEVSAAGNGGFRGNAFELSLPPQEARSVSEQGFWSIMFTPKPPYWGRVDDVDQASISYPVETTSEERILVGDIECLVLHGPDGGPLAIVGTV